jgi:hypothetical protein
MNDQNQIETNRTAKTRGRGCVWWLGASLASLLGLMLVGYIYEPLAEAADAKAYPPLTQSPNDMQSQSNSQSQPFSLPAMLARFGIVRLLARPLGIMPSVPFDEKAYFSRLVRPQSAQTLTNESQNMPASSVEASAVKTFGDLPVMVLTAKLNKIPGWQEWQTELLQLSSNSQQLFAESDHNIQFEEPEAAVAAILQIFQQVRETGTR